MPVAKTVHADSLYADAGTLIAFVSGTDGIADWLFTATEFIDGEVFLAHVVRLVSG